MTWEGMCHSVTVVYHCHVLMMPSMLVVGVFSSKVMIALSARLRECCREGKSSEQTCSNFRQLLRQVMKTMIMLAAAWVYYAVLLSGSLNPTVLVYTSF